MGGHHSHEAKTGTDSGSGMSTPRGSQRGAGSRSGSGADLQGLAETQEKPPPSMVPVEKLAKLLAQRSQKEDGVNGITEKTFTKYLFPMYPELARQFFDYLHRTGKCKNKHISLATFKQQCERIMSILDDSLIIETYVKMFSSSSEEGTVTPDCLRKLLYTSYKLSMDHYPEGPQICLMAEQTLSAAVGGCFHARERHSVGFVVRWLEEQCPRLVFPVHRYCVHSLATAHRRADAADGAGGGGLELGTPVLERGATDASALLPLSVAWLVAGAAPPLYARAGAAPAAPTGAAAWLARLVCAVPGHWVPLYRSTQHGGAANRFLHHTLAYRGPSVLLLRTADALLAALAPVEWREAAHYWGGPDAALLQIFPHFEVLERGGKIFFLNTHLRGYPKGLRIGSDPREPIVDINEDFDTVTYRGGGGYISAIEVWGCGDQRSREAQLDIKKWQVAEAERQRHVKLSAADWLDHPDRYLLELAGRPQYNNSNT